MNTNTFERKSFLNNPVVELESNMFQTIQKKNSVIISVDLLRATANEAAQLKEHLYNLNVPENKSVVIDLSKSTFIDSTFLSTIVSFNKKNKFNKEGIKLVVKDPRQFAILRITKIDSIFKIYSNLDEAI